MPRERFGDEPRRPKTVTLDVQARQWADATGNASSYINDLLVEREMQVEDAAMLLRARGVTAAGVLAAADATNGLLWSDDVPHADQVRAAMEDTEAHAGHGVSLVEYAALTSLDEAAARAVRLLAWETMHGRSPHAMMGEG